MGGESKTKQTQSSTTAPWAEAQPALQGILSQLTGNLGNTGVTGDENAALRGLEQNAYTSAGTYGPQISDYAKTLLSGGGATDQAGNVNANYQRFVDQTNPLASNVNYNPYDTPGLKDALSTLTGDITRDVNSSFAAAGRDFSGANMNTLARGLTSGLAPTLVNQFNANRTAQQGAAGNLYNAGNTNAGILAGLQQQKLANQGQGVTAAGQATDAGNAGYNATLQAEAARRGIPVQALGLLAQIGIPIAGLGGQSTGQSTGTQTDSGVNQFLKIATGIGSLWPKAPISFGGG